MEEADAQKTEAVSLKLRHRLESLLLPYLAEPGQGTEEGQQAKGGLGTY